MDFRKDSDRYLCYFLSPCFFQGNSDAAIKSTSPFSGQQEWTAPNQCVAIHSLSDLSIIFIIPTTVSLSGTCCIGSAESQIEID